MVFDLEMIKTLYAQMEQRVKKASEFVNKPLTLTEKILYAHLYDADNLAIYERGKDYVDFMPDRVAMQDATAQMALLQFMQAGKARTAVPSTVHCDHLIQAKSGASSDLEIAKDVNKEVYDFLASVSNKYGIGFWKPGAGIIHQVVLENYAFPGGMMIGTDSHTVNAGGLGMVAVGVGGADAVDVMAGMPWELKFPKLIGVKLTGKLCGWASAKDVILKLGAEVGATTSIFGYDKKMEAYLRETNREEVADEANKIKHILTGDKEVYENPELYFEQVIEINLSELEPHINGPFSPDKAWKISEFAQAIKENDFPQKLGVGLIGSCTNSSYEDITRAASVAKQALDKNLKVKSEFTITPGSEMVRYTVDRDGLLSVFGKIGGVVLANACGPCIGQWARHNPDKEKKNSIITSFNRNFAKRNDGNPNTFAFVASPEIVTALAIAGDLSFNPMTDTLKNENQENVKLDEPQGIELPPKGFAVEDNGFVAPAENGEGITIAIAPDSQRLQLLTPFDEWDGKDFKGLKLLIKAKGKCTTDHISMAGPWLRYRGHLDNISNNLLIGAVNNFNEKTNNVKNQLTGEYGAVPDIARAYKAEGCGSLVVGDENYGEGSSREHAAMEPRHLGVKVVIVRSFARIHETNLKKQGVLALTFANKPDYEKIKENDTVDIVGLENFQEGKQLTVVLHHEDGTQETFPVNHTYNSNQIEWFKNGSALNLIRKNNR